MSNDKPFGAEYEYITKFRTLSSGDQVDILARTLYVTIHLDPVGYPNGLPTWDELPIIDTNFNYGADKARYISAAIQVRRLLSENLNDLYNINNDQI